MAEALQIVSVSDSEDKPKRPRKSYNPLDSAQYSFDTEVRFQSSSAQRLKRTSFYEPVDGGWTSKSSSWENCRHRIPRSQIAGPLVFVLRAATVTRGKERASSSEALWLGPVGMLLCISTYPLLAAAAAPLGSSETGWCKMNARSIRYFVWSKNKQLLLKDGQAKPSRKQQPPTVSKADWDAFIEGHKDPAGLLLFTTATPGGSYICLFPPVLDELQLLHQQGYLTKVLLASDATFNLERDEWTYTAVTTVYRCLDHRWRKSGFFLGMARHNRELGAVHQRALHAVHAALQERNLPTACQLHTDWFPGMKEAGRAVAASMKYIPGIEHLLHNVSKSRNRAEGGEMLRVPRLKARPLHVMASTVHTLALLPTLSLHIIALRVWLARVADADGWNAECLATRWWYGHMSTVIPGHPPSQQQAEQSHRALKRAISNSPTRTAIDVLKTAKEAAGLWRERTALESSYNLFTPAGYTGTVPLNPDAWMTSPGNVLYRNRLPALGTMAMPTIHRILEDARRRPGTIVEKSRSRGSGRCFFMKCGVPEELDVARIEYLWRQLQEKNLDRLQRLLEEGGALVDQKMLFKKLREDWIDLCFVAHVQHGAGKVRVQH
ncbi:unnamed protein product [Symbiodinium natans]|uniref:Uncharacterized protein n=1 Tax=Symbiodinium natans TaxID=878477 RepID=A0A812JVI9_9DINO|nr:unnamed protein product [Symbiodinium natans]